MRISDISHSIASKLSEDMKILALGFKSFPFHIHLGGHDEKFSIYWTTKEKHFGRPDRRDIVSEIVCEVVGLFDKTILLKAYCPSHRRYMGQEIPDFGSNQSHWHKQEWRSSTFLVEASPPALWSIMEAHANFDSIISNVTTE